MDAIAKKLFWALLLFQVTIILVECGPTKNTKKANTIMTPEQLEKHLTNKMKTVSKEKVKKVRSAAAVKLQRNLLRVLEPIADKKNEKEVPTEVRETAAAAVPVVKNKDILQPLNAALPYILKETVNLTATPAEQTQIILRGVVGSATNSAMKLPLQGMADALTANLNGMNVLIAKTLAGSPDLVGVGGVVKNMISTLGGINEATVFSASGVAPLLGGLLGGVG